MRRTDLPGSIIATEEAIMELTQWNESDMAVVTTKLQYASELFKQLQQLQLASHREFEKIYQKNVQKVQKTSNSKKKLSNSKTHKFKKTHQFKTIYSLF